MMWCAVLLSFLLAGPVGPVGPVGSPFASTAMHLPTTTPVFMSATWTPDARQAAEVPPDRWLAEDKLQHFALSFAATTMTYAVARFALAPDAALPVAGSTALLLGVGKEVADVRAGGPFSLKDLAWDAAGVALGVALAYRTR